MHTLDESTIDAQYIQPGLRPTKLISSWLNLPDVSEGQKDILLSAHRHTNYDDLLERAFGDSAFDLVTYRVGSKDQQPKLVHWIDRRWSANGPAVRMFPI